MEPFEITMFVHGLENPEIATFTIEADSKQEAEEWVLDNMELITKAL